MTEALMRIHQAMQQLDAICQTPRTLWETLPHIAATLQEAYEQGRIKETNHGQT